MSADNITTTATTSVDAVMMDSTDDKNTMSSSSLVQDLLDTTTTTVPPMDKSLSTKLESFCLQHLSQNRPMVLVSSGGTAADLEVRTVRSLENFSTGLRGAMSVEQFVERGYAVVHLWRVGSTSPYGRVVSEALGLKHGNYGISTDALNRLFQHNDSVDHDDDGDDDDIVLDDIPTTSTSTNSDHNNTLALHRRISNNEHVQRAWRQWRSAKSKIITIPFRTVEEYLMRLQECAIQLRSANSLCMFYLAAAVSDFYCPQKTHHKIQSSNENDGNHEKNKNNHNLILTLAPVPKVLGVLRTHWAPNAFVVSFKLETDPALLRQKAERAITNYGVHMVIGNVLGTHHDTVHVLHCDNHNQHDVVENYNDNGDDHGNSKNWTMTTLTKPSSSFSTTTNTSSTTTTDSFLEADLVEFCVLQHFAFIAQHLMPEQAAHMAKTAHDRWIRHKKELQQEQYWNVIKNHALQLGATVLGMGLSYLLSKTIQRRIGGQY